MIYFFEYQPGGPIKIGFAKNYYKRLLCIQAYCPYPLRALAIAKGSKPEEQALHVRFKRSRLCGEWFKPTKELLAHIATLPKPRLAKCHTVKTWEAVHSPSTRKIWFDLSISSNHDAAVATGLSVQILRIWLGPSGRQPARMNTAEAKKVGAIGGRAKGAIAAARRSDLIPTERVHEILSQPGMSYLKAARLLGDGFSESTLRRQYPGHKQEAA